MIEATPSAYRGVTSYLILRDAARALQFYQQAFAAQPGVRLDNANGTVAHAELVIAGGHIMMSEENLAMGYKSPQSLGGSPVSLMFYVPDVDQAFVRAIAAGCTQQRPVQDQFYGDRSGTLGDPFGITWTIATHTEDLPIDEINRRMAALSGNAS